MLTVKELIEELKVGSTVSPMEKQGMLFSSSAAADKFYTKLMNRD